MTKKEFYTAIANSTADEAIVAYAKQELELMDSRNARAADKRASKAAEADAPIVEAIAKFLASHTSATASEIAGSMDDVSVSKVSALCRKYSDKFVSIAGTKSGQPKSYSLAQ